MAPFKSSLAKSAGKLFGVFKERDLSLRGATQSSRRPLPPSMVLTGGTKYQPGDGYSYHIFKGTGTQTLVSDINGTLKVDFCLVGGGGGGASLQGPGGAAGSGGGAGGMIYRLNTDITIPTSSNVTVSLGTGGTIAPPAYSVHGTDGGDSVFTDANGPIVYTSKGGAGGVMYDSPGPGRPGGSGSGSSYQGGAAGASTQVPSMPVPLQPYGFGNAGGNTGPTSYYDGAGGGGAGGVGSPAIGSGLTPNDGSGGLGKSTVFPGPKFPGEPTIWKTAVGDNGFLAAGGGGGTYSPNIGTYSSYAGGGGGGGGGPANTRSPASEKAGVDNTGSGGGQGDGGDGVFLIRYLTINQF